MEGARERSEACAWRVLLGPPSSLPVEDAEARTGIAGILPASVPCVSSTSP